MEDVAGLPGLFSFFSAGVALSRSGCPLFHRFHDPAFMTFWSCLHTQHPPNSFISLGQIPFLASAATKSHATIVE